MTPAEALERVPLFAGLDPDERAWLAGLAEPVDLDAGEVLVAEGAQADTMYVVVDGLLEASKLQGGRPVRLGTFGPGEPLGELALLARRNRSATVRALRPSHLLRIGAEVFDEVVRLPSVALHLLHTVLERLESQEARLRDHAKMAALGTLAAGLLHDLNNPAAAVRSSVRRLAELLDGWKALAVEFAGLEPEEARAVEELRAEVGRRPQPAELDPLERSDRAEALSEWLAGHGVERPWVLSTAIADLGWGTGDLDLLAARLPPDDLPVAVRWLALDGEAARLLDDAGRGAEHIADVARRSKGYSRVDQAPIGDVDVHDGLDTALALIRSKVGDVRVRRDFAPDLPRVEGYPADLNEVWLNLVDNALDALGGSGTLVLRTGVDDEGRVLVEVEDSGPGVPEDVRARIFEPFFTTKAVGLGTGLGLAQVFRIVVQQHGGDVDVDSMPGRTVFRVRLHRRLPPGLDDLPWADDGPSADERPSGARRQDVSSDG